MSPNTNFSSFGHEQLIAMLQGNSPAAVLDSADTLSRLSDLITHVTDNLQYRIQALEWQGESADQFRKWAAQVLKFHPVPGQRVVTLRG